MLVRSQNNVYEWIDMFTCGLMFQPSLAWWYLLCTRPTRLVGFFIVRMSISNLVHAMRFWHSTGRLIVRFWIFKSIKSLTLTLTFSQMKFWYDYRSTTTSCSLNHSTLWVKHLDCWL
jgi:hypothetical protein